MSTEVLEVARRLAWYLIEDRRDPDSSAHLEE